MLKSSLAVASGASLHLEMSCRQPPAKRTFLFSVVFVLRRTRSYLSRFSRYHATAKMPPENEGGGSFSTYFVTWSICDAYRVCCMLSSGAIIRFLLGAVTTNCGEHLLPFSSELLTVLWLHFPTEKKKCFRCRERPTKV